MGKFAAMLVVFAAPMAVICLYPVVLSAYGNVYLPAAYGAIVGFFFLGMALLAIGMYISSVTESQAVAAGLCFVVMLVNYFLSDLAGFASATAYSSLAALAVTALIACGIVYLMTKNGFVSLLLAAVLEAGLIGGYLWDSSRFEGLFPQIISRAEPVCPVLYHRQRRVRRDRHCVLPVGDGIFPVFERAVSGEAEVE